MTRSINLIKKNHYRGLKHLQNTLDNFFSDAWWPTQTNELWEEFQLFSKLSEDKENYYLEVDLPGVKKEDVKIEVENNTLRIQGERKGEEKRMKLKDIIQKSFMAVLSVIITYLIQLIVITLKPVMWMEYWI